MKWTCLPALKGSNSYKLEAQPAEPVSLTWHKNDTEANFKVR